MRREAANSESGSSSEVREREAPTDEWGYPMISGRQITTTNQSGWNKGKGSCTVLACESVQTHPRAVVTACGSAATQGTPEAPSASPLVEAIMRVDLCEVFSPPRVTLGAQKMGLEPGDAFDLTNG